ncbi:MAG: haloacid dehalogenase type II [Alphaproteobacteria bacterium]|nr:MAG: haloacid dehalogenase type II [Alphaproteobacteria bacterium]
MEIEALIFDVFGTLVDWRSGVAAEVKRAFAGRADAPDALAFADAWRAEYDPAMARIRDGDRGYVPLDDLHLENLDRVLAAFGLSDALDGPARAALNRAWEKLPPWHDTVPGLDALRERRIVAPCSNGSIALMTRLARFAGLRWDCVLGADIARDYKPSPAVYLAACAALRLPPERVMMVAAHNRDLAAARAAGLRTGFFPRPREHGPGQTTDLVPEQDWEVIASDLQDLARQMAGAGGVGGRILHDQVDS